MVTVYIPLLSSCCLFIPVFLRWKTGGMKPRGSVCGIALLNKTSRKWVRCFYLCNFWCRLRKINSNRILSSLLLFHYYYTWVPTQCIRYLVLAHFYLSFNGFTARNHNLSCRLTLFCFQLKMYLVNTYSQMFIEINISFRI